LTTWLAPHFSLEELTATRQPFDNTPPDWVLRNLKRTAQQMEAVRTLLGGKAILVSSGYRSPKVNKAVRGSKTSAHLAGFAVDFICPRFGKPLDVCRAIAASTILFDQLIEEGTWIHISFDPRLRQQVLTKSGAGFGEGLKA
jgi:hypothetical protein